MVSEAQITRISDAARDADMRHRYFALKAGTYRSWERISAIAALFFTSSAAGTILSGLASRGVESVVAVLAFLATALPIVLRLGGASARCSALHTRFYRFMVDYDALLLRAKEDQGLSDEDVDDILSTLLKSEGETGSDAALDFGMDDDLVERLEKEVSIARGFEEPA